MAIRTIRYGVTENGITPATLQPGGVQGDHRITDLAFEIDDSLWSSLQSQAEDKRLVYRFDCYDASGGTHLTDPQDLTGQTVTCPLEYWLTKYGGNIRIHLVISVIDDSGEGVTEMELFTFPAELSLKKKPCANNLDPHYNSLSGLATVAKNAAERATSAADAAVTAKDLTVEARAALEGGSLWIFDGGNSQSEHSIDIVVDSELSSSSTNPVQNRVIKAKLDEIDNSVSSNADDIAELQEQIQELPVAPVDYVEETGTETVPHGSGNLVWFYRKWNSGIVECWCNVDHFGKDKIASNIELWTKLEFGYRFRVTDEKQEGGAEILPRWETWEITYPFKIHNAIVNATWNGGGEIAVSFAIVGSEYCLPDFYTPRVPNEAVHIGYLKIHIIGKWK